MNSSNIYIQHSKVTREQRNQKNNHDSFVLWFTGLSGSGKSTLAHAVEEKLFEGGRSTFVLDGDNIRHGLSRDLDFSDKGRKENIRRISETAKLMVEAGVIVMTAFISPFKQDRDFARKIFQKDSFIEIYCKSRLETCESRDVKGLYKRARTGEIRNYTGINSPYEAPINPELVVDTESESLEESVASVIDFLKSKKIIN